MQIDKPDTNEIGSGESVLEPAAPLPPEPPPTSLEPERVLSRSGAPLRRRPLRIHPRSLLGMALIAGGTIGAALIGRAATKRGALAWYRTLKKPAWTPSVNTFGRVWPVLYALSAVSAWRVWRSPPSRERSMALGLWGTQIATNAAWTPLFFGAKRPRAALLDLKANVGSAASYALAAAKIDRTSALLMLPYVAWVAFAGTVNSSVARHNSHGLAARLGGTR